MNFPNIGPQMVNHGHIESVATLLRERGSLTKVAAKLLADEVGQWALVKIDLRFEDYAHTEAIVVGATDAAVEVVLCKLDYLGYGEFDIKSSFGLVSAPIESPTDPNCSICLLRAIAGAVSIQGFKFPDTVYPEVGCSDLSMPLPLAAKPEALSIAQSIWAKVAQQVPAVTLGDHTEKDSMGTTNLGSMFKVCSVLLAQGALCKYRVHVIPLILTMCFFSGQNVVCAGTGIGKTSWLVPTLAQRKLKILGIERYAPNHDLSAQTLQRVRDHEKVHDLQVSSL